MGGRGSRAEAASISFAPSTRASTRCTSPPRSRTSTASGLVSAKEMKRLDRNVQFALAAAKEALTAPMRREHERLPARPGRRRARLRHRGSARAAAPVRRAARARARTACRRPSSRTCCRTRRAARWRSRLESAGPNYAVVSACATGSHAIGEGAELVRHGARRRRARRRHRGLHPPALLRRVLLDARSRGRGGGPGDARAGRSTRLEPASSWVRAAGVVMLEELEHARARGATIYAEVLGYGASNDAYHMAAPDPDSVGVAEMMRAALERAGVEPGTGRLHQRPRDIDAARRRRRDEGDQGRLRRARVRHRGLLDEVDDGASARRRRRGRSDHDGARDPPSA